MSTTKNHLDELTEEEFKAKLIEFFNRHDPGGLRAVDDIVNRLSHQKAQVFQELTEMYAPPGVKEGSYNSLMGGPPMGANIGSTPI